MAAMESTASYWKPLHNILKSSGLHTMVVNARHMKAVPGRKTDVKDSEWIADLLQPSYIPDRDQRELRELVSYRKSLIQDRTRELNRLQKMPEHVDELNVHIKHLNDDIDSHMKPEEKEAAGAIREVTGLGITSAQAVIAVIGTDMSRFPTDKHISSWAGLCPGG